MLETSIFSFSHNVFYPIKKIFTNLATLNSFNLDQPRPGGSVVSMSDPKPGAYEFETRLRPNFFPAYFRLSPLLRPVRKVVGGFGKEFVLVLVLESQKTNVRHRPP